MAKQEHLAILDKGVEEWNDWRRLNPGETPDFSRADLTRAKLRGANLGRANLHRANLPGAYLIGADLGQAILRKANLLGADLSRADLRGADLRASVSRASLYRTDLAGAMLTGADLIDTNFSQANLRGADLAGAYLRRANLSNADLSLANLRGADLRGAILDETTLRDAIAVDADLRGSVLIRCDLTGADLTGCRIFGISAWKLDLTGANQRSLIATDEDEPEVTVDDLEVAQFVHLLLHNDKVRRVIDTVTSKMVLVLGRFTAERKAVLDRLRDELRTRDYVPVMFDFDPVSSRNLTETVSTLAHMARFVIADISDPRSIPQELQRIVPNLPSLPVQPIIEVSQEPWGMFSDFRDYPWVLEPYRYEGVEQLLASVQSRVIMPAEEKANEIAQRRAMSNRR